LLKAQPPLLYGSSEAVGGLINIITKDQKVRSTADIFSTSWLETNIDLGYRANFGKSRCNNWCKLF
jgi:outer membrane receptor for ferrienterochelin and colicins